MVYMYTFAETPDSVVEASNNQRLRALVDNSGLTQAAALAAFNKKLGPAGYSFQTWKSFMSDPKSKRFRPINSELLKHAENVFSRHSLTV